MMLGSLEVTLPEAKNYLCLKSSSLIAVKACLLTKYF